MATTTNGAAPDAAGSAWRQWPASDEVVVEGPLEHVGLEALARRGGDHAVRFAALPVTGLLVLRGDRAASALADRAREALGLELPEALGTTTSEGADTPPGAGRVLRWRAPDEWLLSCPIAEAHELTVALEDGLGEGTGACIVDVSGGYARLELAGEGVDALLRRSTAYDVSPHGLPPGKVVGTTFAKTTALLRRIDPARVELVVRRSYADYAWTWLQRAAGPSGLTVELPPGA